MDDIPVSVDPNSQRFIPRLRLFIRKKGLSYSTEKTYIRWILNYILFHDKRHPKDMGSTEIDKYLTYLAVERNVSPGTQRNALNALIFLYKQYFEVPIEDLDLDFAYAKTSQRIPVVLSHDEALTIIENMDENYRLITRMMYGCGLRLMECCRLRIQDIDFSMNQIIVRESKGKKQRTTVLPVPN